MNERNEMRKKEEEVREGEKYIYWLDQHDFLVINNHDCHHPKFHGRTIPMQLGREIRPPTHQPRDVVVVCRSP